MEAAAKDVDILLCDIGNSALKLAFASPAGIAAVFALPCVKNWTSDYVGLQILQILQLYGREACNIRACVCCSVVPGLSGLLRQAARRYLGCQFLAAPADLPVPLLNRYKRPEEAGADRLVAAWGCRKKLPETRGIVLADFGSVSTFDCVCDDSWLGGLLFPGIRASMTAMRLAAPGLPELSPDAVACGAVCEPCADTRQAMNSGIFYGFAALSTGLCASLRKTLPEPVKIVATGGFAKAVASLSPVFDEILPDLVLEGLAALYYENN